MLTEHYTPSQQIDQSTSLDEMHWLFGFFEILLAADMRQKKKINLGNQSPE